MKKANVTAPGRISVVVGAYNVEDYLGRCLDSILCQTYRNLEVIVVNDCSTDGTAAIADRYRSMDDRVKVVHLSQNVGAYAARIEGIAVATGEFIGFVDSDDWIDVRMFGDLIQAAIDRVADIVICGAKIVDPNGTILGPKVTIPNRKVVEGDALERFCRFEFGSGVLWNKLYRAELILAHYAGKFSRGPDCPVDYDYLVNIGCFSGAQRVALVPDAHYSYFERTGSISRAGNPPLEFAQTLRGYVTCLEAHAGGLGDRICLVDQLYSGLLTMPCYRVSDASGLNPYSEEIAESLRRLADVHPQGIHALIHAFDPAISSKRPSVRMAARRLRNALKQFVSTVVSRLPVVRQDRKLKASA